MPTQLPAIKILKNTNKWKRTALFLLSVLLLPLLFCNSVRAQSITLAPPTSSTTYVDNLSVSYSITGDASAQQVQIICTYTSGPYNSIANGKVWILTMSTPSLSKTFTLKPTDLANAANAFTASPSTPMYEGFYSFKAQYIRPASAGSLTVTTTTRTNVYLDVQTVPPVLVLPKKNARVKNLFVLKDSIPEFYLSGSKRITFAGPNNATLTMVDNKLKDSINMNMQTVSTAMAPSNISSVSGDAALAEGAYAITVQYQDRYSHPLASSVTNIIYDTHTETPAISAPATGSANNQNVNFNLNIPEKYAPGTATLTFNQSGVINTLVLANNLVAGANSFALDTRHLRASSQVLSAGADTLANGSYSITLSYQDSLGNPAASAAVNNVNIKNITTPVTITAPANNTVVNGKSFLNLAYTLPEKPGAGTLKLILSNTATTITAFLAANTTGAQTLTLDPRDIAASPGVVSTTSNTVIDGTYNVTVTYADTLANTAVTSNSIAVNFINQTKAPVLILPGSGSSNTQNVQVSFNLPVAALSNKATLQLFGPQDISIDLLTSGTGVQTYTLNGLDLTGSTGVTSTSQATIPSGNYTLLLGYQDIYGNDMAYDSQTNVTLTGTTPPVLSTQAITPPCGATGVGLGGGITSATAGLTITYYADAGLTNLITDTVHIAGTYYIKATNTYSLSTSAPIVVNAFPVNPIVTTQSISPACGAASVSLATGISSATTGLTVDYFSDAGLTTGISSTVSTAGTYYVRVTNTSGCTASAPIVVNGFPVNPIVTTQSISPACGAATVSLATGISSATTGLTVDYFSDAGLTTGVSSTVSAAG
ncbi:MAG TPA: hypothetical protein VGM63_05170, partial [Mucilaginibacter sp.]